MARHPAVFVVALLLAACGSADEPSALPATPVSIGVGPLPLGEAASSGESSAEAVPASTPAVVTSTTELGAQSLPPLPTTTVEREPFAVEWARPSGSLELDPDDVIAWREDGALVLFQDLGSLEPSSEVLVGDVATLIGDDNDVADVAGVVEGALVIGVCCEANGGLWSIDEADGRLRRFASGVHPTYSRDRDWMIALDGEGNELLVHDVPSALVTSPTLGLEDDSIEPQGVIWAPDDASVFVLVDEGGAQTLVQIAARPPFEQIGSVDVDALFPGADTDAILAGLGPSGELALAATDGDEVVIRFVDPVELVEREDRERTLPPTATSVHIGPDGSGLLWIQYSALWYQPLFSDPFPLGLGIRAAWFVGG